MQKRTRLFGVLTFAFVFLNSSLLPEGDSFFRGLLSRYKRKSEQRKRNKLFLGAINKEELEEIKKTSFEDVDINFNQDGNALHKVVRFGKKYRLGVIDFLIKNKIDVNAVNKNGETPLMDLMRIRTIEDNEGLLIIDKLLDAGAKINLQNIYGNTALHIAARRGRSAYCIKLLRVGAKPCIKNKEGCFPWQMAYYDKDLRELLFDLYSKRRHPVKQFFDKFLFS